MNCDRCGKKKKKLDFTDRHTGEQLCYPCAFKFVLKRDKNLFKTINKFINYITLRHGRRIYSYIDKIIFILFMAYIATCLYHNIKNFDLLNLSMVFLVAFMITNEI